MKVAHLSRRAYKAHIEYARSIRRQQVSSRMEYRKQLQKARQESRQHVAKSFSEGSLRTRVDCRLDYGKLKERYLQTLQEQVKSELAQQQHQDLLGASANGPGFSGNKILPPLNEIKSIENKQRQDANQQKQMQEGMEIQLKRAPLKEQREKQLAQLQAWRERKVVLEALQLEEEVQKVEKKYRGLAAALTAVNEVNCAIQEGYRANQQNTSQSFDRELAGSLKNVQSQLYGRQCKNIPRAARRTQLPPAMSHAIPASTNFEFSDLLEFRKKQETAIYHEELRLILGRTRSKQNEMEKRRQHTTEDSAI